MGKGEVKGGGWDFSRREDKRGFERMGEGE